MNKYLRMYVTLYKYVCYSTLSMQLNAMNICIDIYID